MPTPEKAAVVKELNEKLQGSSAAMLTDYRGLTVSEMMHLRRKLGELGAEYHVVKNTLLRLASEGTSFNFGPHLEGPTAVAIMQGDPIAPTKVLVDYVRDHKAMSVKAGVVEGELLSPDEVVALSKIPPREVLLSLMVGGIQAPISGLVGTLQGVVSNLAYTLQAVVDKKTAEGAAA
ncbi:MAG TPA: 50S ribosomal protein L10 [Armatimonadota bacterium]|jgi:large subunit ribosomal protein L10